MFNTYFKQASYLDDSNATLPDDQTVLDHEKLSYINITVQDVQDQINALNTKKSYGPDEILHIL